MQRKIDLFSYNGKTVEYSIIGKGEPILVMHGGHSNCHEEFGYDALIENGYSVITPSRAGYGRTSKEIGKSLSMSCECYARLVEHLKIDKVYLLAISAGGPSGIYFASAYPEKVHSLTLQSAVSKKWLMPQDKEYKAARMLFHPKTESYTWKLISTMNNFFPQFIFKQMFPSFSKLKYKEADGFIRMSDVEAIRKMNNRQRSGYGFMIDLAQVNEVTTADLQKISCPTLIMHSKHDSSVPIEHAKHSNENITNSKLHLLETWGHLIWLGTSSHKTNETILRFLAGQRDRSLVPAK
jgi:pimeloyl-ACP methyl ester carboxylesterase